MHTTGGGVGTNQYQVQGSSQRRIPIVSPPPLLSQSLPDPAVDPYKTAADPSQPPEMLLALAQHGDQTTLMILARNKACPAEALWLLAQRMENQKLYTLIARLDCSTELLRHICKERGLHEWSITALVDHPNADAEIIGYIAMERRAQLQARKKAVQHPLLDPTLLPALAEDPEVDVRRAVAQKSGCPSDILQRLTTDDDLSVICAAVRNPNCPIALWQEMAKALGAAKRAAAASNAMYQSDHMAADPAQRVRFAVAQKPTTMPETLATLMADSDMDVRRSVALNPNTDETTLLRASSDSSTAVRKAILERTHCPAAVLINLLKRKEFRQSALNHPDCPDHIRAIKALGGTSGIR